MKLVIQTQHRENYGAHDWDGKGECPQYWKFKGGNTYVVQMNVRQAMDKEYYQLFIDAVTERNEYFEEYVIGEDLIDDQDYRESDHIPEWDSVIHLSFDVKADAVRAHRTQNNQEYGYMRKEIAKKFETYLLVNGEQKEYKSSFEMINGDQVTYSELGNWMKIYAPEAA